MSEFLNMIIFIHNSKCLLLSHLRQKNSSRVKQFGYSLQIQYNFHLMYFNGLKMTTE
jgi:hypothetical protein